MVTHLACSLCLCSLTRKKGKEDSVLASTEMHVGPASIWAAGGAGLGLDWWMLREKERSPKEEKSPGKREKGFSFSNSFLLI